MRRPMALVTPGPAAVKHESAAVGYASTAAHPRETQHDHDADRRQRVSLARHISQILATAASEGSSHSLPKREGML